MTRDEALFNVKAVVQQTGVKPDALRAWERRYGLPTPARSAGGHRLYTQRGIDTIRWLVARQQEGLSVSRAVELWRQIEASGGDPLRAQAHFPPPPSSAVAPASSMLDLLRKEWLAACLAYDEPRAELAEAQAFALYPPETVCFDLLQWALRELGDLWQRGTASVQQGLFASELAVRRVESLLAAAPPAARPGRVAVACPPEEQHTFGLLLLTLLLRRRGWAVVYLGANVPIEQLDAAVSAIRPALVVLAAMRLNTAATLLQAARALQGRVPVAYGGGVFNALPSIRPRIPGHFLGETLEAAADAIDALLSAPRPVPVAEPIPAEALAALEHFRERRGTIEVEVGKAAGDWGLQSQGLTHAHEALASHLEAALALGDIALLDAGAGGAEEGHARLYMPADTPPRYLKAYCQAAEEQLGERGGLILAWLRRAAGC